MLVSPKLAPLKLLLLLLVFVSESAVWILMSRLLLPTGLVNSVALDSAFSLVHSVLCHKASEIRGTYHQRTVLLELASGFL